MELAYKVGDRVYMERWCELVLERELEDGGADFYIEDIDDSEEDDLPYCIRIEFDDGQEDTHWVGADEIIGLSSVVRIGGE